jgi:hypothetical protein
MSSPMSSPNGPGQYVRVITKGRSLPDIEAEVARAAAAGVRILVSTAEGLNGLDAGSDSRSAAIAAWADGLSQEHGLEWRRVGRDVLFTLLG